MAKHFEMATQRLIHAVWTLEYRIISETEAEIVTYCNTNDIGISEERQLERCSLVETEGRIVTGIKIAPYSPFVCWAEGDNVTKEYKVINPKHIFGYPH